MATDNGTQSQDGKAALVQKLTQEGWTDADFAMLASSECGQLRGFAKHNVKSRVASTRKTNAPVE
jgi:hypothetical protein